MGRHSPPFSAAPRPPPRAFPGDPSRLLEVEPTAWLRRLPGRETFAWPPGVGLDPYARDGAARAIVKRSRAGAWSRAWSGIAQRIARGRGRHGGPMAAGRREYENLVALAELGIAVPAALCWCEDGRGASLVAMELVGHRESLRTRLARVGADERRRLARELLQLVLRLHGNGWYHRDLYLEHVLVDERADERTDERPDEHIAERIGERIAERAGAPRLVLIDVGRARRRRAPRRRWLVKDLAALLHSTPDAVAPRERLRFAAGWLSARGVHGRAGRRALLRAVLAKQARMAAHRPRHAHASAREARR